MSAKKYKIGIIGSQGMVGGALKRYFERKPNYELFLYDKAGEGSVEEVNRADIVYICVPTPVGAGNECDTSIVESAISVLMGNKIVVIKSTVIPGTTQKIQDKYQQHKILFNPEFLTEVTADNDTQFPDRQIVGYTKKSFTVAKDIIQQLPLAPFERIVTAEEAEMCKYYGNTWFATKVIFANQMYDICDKAGINYDNVMDLVAADKRIGRTHLTVFHKGGRGYGGKCLPKDTKALIAFSESLGLEPKLLRVVEDINNNELKCQK